MSAPDTNIDKQVTHHKAPLIGMAVVGAAVGALFVAFLAWTVSQADDGEVTVTTPSVVISE
ncbi:hypothetical protein [Tateyamaria sp. SN3-11]|uniref:hypothetical protein n=1 Tax=Tateyamaria sp. SN3-11 TaxID=3092147 RepID=UPI0039E872A5